jgi:hypothetical protein
MGSKAVFDLASRNVNAAGLGALRLSLHRLARALRLQVPETAVRGHRDQNQAWNTPIQSVEDELVSDDSAGQVIGSRAA